MNRTVLGGVLAGIGGTLLGMYHLSSYPSDSSLASLASDNGVSSSASNTTLDYEDYDRSSLGPGYHESANGTSKTVEYPLCTIFNVCPNCSTGLKLPKVYVCKQTSDSCCGDCSHCKVIPCSIARSMEMQSRTQSPGSITMMEGKVKNMSNSNPSNKEDLVLAPFNGTMEILEDEEADTSCQRSGTAEEELELNLSLAESSTSDDRKSEMKPYNASP
ncbi:hypothetical protein SCHPADRAFT_588615 [Schizopora paradoxa]|uniref:Uncharacterized protein n=1 Tax=Schizopora paradoxa TaxID=27342 RepID=A0A0H2RHF8_9AGAM|nr:hypothetical protein SCHPADRAFT_588615 [Schizopora paradoxa]